MKKFGDSKTTLASKKTASSLCLGSDKHDTVNSKHENRKDEEKASKIREADSFQPKWIENKKDSTALKNNFIYGSDQVDRDAKKNKPVSSKTDVLQHSEKSNILSDKDTVHRKQEFLKSNIFGVLETSTQVNKPLVTNKTVQKDEKILEFNDISNTMKNKKNELNSHFNIGEDSKFEDYAKMPMTYEKNSWKKDNQDDKIDHLQSNIFHDQTTQKRDLSKVNLEKKNQKDLQNN